MTGSARCYGAAATGEAGTDDGMRGRRDAGLSAVTAGVALVLALAAAHCLAGFAVYGLQGARAVEMLQVGSLSLSTQSPVLVQQAVERSWQQAVEPSQKSLEAEGEAMLAGMRADEHLSHEVAAVKAVEAKFSKPQLHESLEQLLRPPPPGQQPTMLLQVSTGGGISSLGVGVPGFQHFENVGRGKGDDYYQAKFRYGGSAMRQQLASTHLRASRGRQKRRYKRDMRQIFGPAEQAAAQQAETADEERTIRRIRTPAAATAGWKAQLKALEEEKSALEKRIRAPAAGTKAQLTALNKMLAHLDEVERQALEVCTHTYI